MERRPRIRVAIGAQAADVRRLVVGHVLVAAAFGAVVGLAAGHWLARSLETLVYGVEPGSWTNALAAAAAFMALVFVAALVPARRATRLQPTEALRVE